VHRDAASRKRVKEMKVVHLVAGELSEGAARGAYWLHQAQRLLGIDSTLITSGVFDLDDPSVIAMGKSPWQRGREYLLARSVNLPLRFFPKRMNRIFSTGFFGLNYKKYRAFREADVVHLHWINGLVSMGSLQGIDKPIVWTLRDMWPLTGGCHYSMGCERYQTGCGQCPQLGSSFELDYSHWVVANKLAKLPKKIRVVGISAWLSERARNSKIFSDFSVQTICNSIDTDLFFPVDQVSSRMALGLPQDKRIILVGAQNSDDFYKGFDLLWQALKECNLRDSHVVIFGRTNPADIAWLEDRCTNLGFLHDHTSLRLAYSSADMFVAPSREEAFGKTLAESLACGTPVVCFDATGPGEIVQHHLNGYKAEPFQYIGLANGIKWILSLDIDSLAKIRANARQFAVEFFDSKKIAVCYMKLYEELVRKI